MSLNRFIMFLQELITMTNCDDRLAVAMAQNILSSLVALAFESQKADSITLRTMKNAEKTFEYIIAHANDFKGVPGDYENNEKKRRRLRLMLVPSC